MTIKKVGDSCPRNSHGARYERVVELLARGKNGYWEKLVASAGYTTEVDHKATSKMDDKRLSLVHLLMQLSQHDPNKCPTT